MAKKVDSNLIWEDKVRFGPALIWTFKRITAVNHLKPPQLKPPDYFKPSFWAYLIFPVTCDHLKPPPKIIFL